MEIHPPQGPVHSAKDFLIHMTTVILGILIALGLEAALEHMHHAAQAREAIENITHEIEGNDQILRSGLASAPIAVRELTSFVSTIEGERSHRGSTPADKNNDLGFGILNLPSTSWATAQSTGVLSYMPYPEVKQFTRLYVLQQQFLAIQEQTLHRWIDLQSIHYMQSEKSFATLSDQRLAELEREAALALSYTQTEIDLGTNLRDEYEKVIGPPKHH